MWGAHSGHCIRGGHYLKNSPHDVQTKGGGGQRPFEQCSKKTALFLRDGFPKLYSKSQSTTYPARKNGLSAILVRYFLHVQSSVCPDMNDRKLK